MDNISANLDGVVAADRPGQRLQWIRFSNHLSRSGYGTSRTLPNHAHDRSGNDVIHEILEKRFGRQVAIVLLRNRSRALKRLQTFQLHAFILEAFDNCTNFPSLHAIRSVVVVVVVVVVIIIVNMFRVESVFRENTTMSLFPPIG